MLHLQLHRFTLRDAEDRDILAMDFHVRSSEMHQSCDKGDAAGIYQVSIVIQYVYIRTNVKAFLASNDAETFCIQRPRATDSLLENP